MIHIDLQRQELRGKWLEILDLAAPRIIRDFVASWMARAKRIEEENNDPYHGSFMSVKLPPCFICGGILDRHTEGCPKHARWQRKLLGEHHA